MTDDAGLDYDDWLRTLDHQPREADDSLDSSDGGIPTAGFVEFTQEVFRDHGPISAAHFDDAVNERQLALAHRAVELVVADLERATGSAAMSFDVDIRTINDDFELVVVSYRGSFQTPVISSLRHPESTAEVADSMQDLIQDEFSATWPVCPLHDRGLYPQVDHGDAVWYCRSGQHVVSNIGDLGLLPA